MTAHTHHLLLALAGRVDDDLLATARELVAVGEESQACELLVATLVADRTPLPADLRAQVVELADARRVEPAAAGLAPAGEGVRHTFGAGPAEASAALTEVASGAAPAGSTVRLAWRHTVAGGAPGPVPHPVVLVELGESASAPEVVSYRVGVHLHRAGLPASVEAYTASEELPAYQRAALAAAGVRPSPVPRAVPDGGAAPRGVVAPPLDRDPAQATAGSTPHGERDPRGDDSALTTPAGLAAVALAGPHTDVPAPSPNSGVAAPTPDPALTAPTPDSGLAAPTRDEPEPKPQPQRDPAGPQTRGAEAAAEMPVLGAPVSNAQPIVGRPLRPAPRPSPTGRDEPHGLPVAGHAAPGTDEPPTAPHGTRRTGRSLSVVPPVPGQQPPRGPRPAPVTRPTPVVPPGAEPTPVRPWAAAPTSDEDPPVLASMHDPLSGPLRQPLLDAQLDRADTGPVAEVTVEPPAERENPVLRRWTAPMPEAPSSAPAAPPRDWTRAWASGEWAMPSAGTPARSAPADLDDATPPHDIPPHDIPPHDTPPHDIVDGDRQDAEAVPARLGDLLAQWRTAPEPASAEDNIPGSPTAEERTDADPATGGIAAAGGIAALEAEGFEDGDDSGDAGPAGPGPADTATATLGSTGTEDSGAGPGTDGLEDIASGDTAPGSPTADRVGSASDRDGCASGGSPTLEDQPSSDVVDPASGAATAAAPSELDRPALDTPGTPGGSAADASVDAESTSGDGPADEPVPLDVRATDGGDIADIEIAEPPALHAIPDAGGRPADGLLPQSVTLHDGAAPADTDPSDHDEITASPQNGRTPSGLPVHAPGTGRPEPGPAGVEELTRPRADPSAESAGGRNGADTDPSVAADAPPTGRRAAADGAPTSALLPGGRRRARHRPDDVPPDPWSFASEAPSGDDGMPPPRPVPRSIPRVRRAAASGDGPGGLFGPGEVPPARPDGPFGLGPHPGNPETAADDEEPRRVPSAPDSTASLSHREQELLRKLHQELAVREDLPDGRRNGSAP